MKTSSLKQQSLFDETMAVINGAFDKWQESQARSNVACYTLLGEIFVRSKAIEDDPALKLQLIAKANKHPDVEASSRFDGAKRTAAELLLTILFGLKEQRGVKSNWLAVIKAAELLAQGGQLDRSVDAFVQWFTTAGFKGAFELIRKPTEGINLKAYDELRAREIDLPDVIPEEMELPNGYALAVMRVDQTPDTATRGYFLGYVVEPKVISAACKLLHRRQAKEEAAFIENCINESGEPDLLIPERHRLELGGRTHFIDEDDRDEFMADVKRDRAAIRKKTGKQIAKWGLAKAARKGRGKAKLPLDRAGIVKIEASSANTVTSVATGVTPEVSEDCEQLEVAV
jgi:hypothetical protein